MTLDQGGLLTEPRLQVGGTPFRVSPSLAADTPTPKFGREGRMAQFGLRRLSSGQRDPDPGQRILFLPSGNYPFTK